MPDQDLLLDAFRLPPAKAIAFLRSKGLAITRNWYDLWQDAHSRAFTVAKVAKLDLLQDIRNAVDEALAEGQTFQTFRKIIEPTLQKEGWWGEVLDDNGELLTTVTPRRLAIIYQTNLQTAYMAGRYQGQMETIDQRPYGQYLAIRDSKTTDICNALHGKVFRLDDPMWDHLYPPNHWGCRSRVRTLSRRQLQREGLTVIDTTDRLITKEEILKTDQGPKAVTVHGIRVDLPEGPKKFYTDPGWDYNPGREQWKPDLGRYDSDIARLFT